MSRRKARHYRGGEKRGEEAREWKMATIEL